MRALRTIKLLREYLIDRCSPENSDDFLQLFDLAYQNVSNGMLASLKELQVEPSIVVSKE